jgi:FkbM family methyltransferase
VKPISRVLLFLARHLPRGYWSVIRFAAKRDTALWDCRLPLRFVPNTDIRADLREPVFAQFLRYGCFPHQAGEDLLCMSILRPGDVVFDVGANIGYPTILFSHAVGVAGKILALEPSPRAFRHLQRTVSGQFNVECVNLAASDHEGEALFYETESLDTSSLQPVSKVEPYSVGTTTLDQLVDRFGAPAFVKIDVEGHEPFVFKGMEHLFQRDSPPMLLFEALSDSALQDALGELSRLAKDQYTVFRVKPDGTVASLSDLGGTNNYLALPAWSRSRIDSLPPLSGWADR